MNWHFQYRDKIFICLTNVFLIAVINKTFGVNMSSVCVWGGGLIVKICGQILHQIAILNVFYCT